MVRCYKAYKLAVFEILGDFFVLPYIACPCYPYIRVYRLYDYNRARCIMKTSVAHTVLVNVQFQEIRPDSSLQIGFIGTRPIGFIGTRLNPRTAVSCARAPSDRKNPPGTDTINCMQQPATET